METTITIKIVLEVPDRYKTNIERFNRVVFDSIKARLFEFYYVRNVLKME